MTDHKDITKQMDEQITANSKDGYKYKDPKTGEVFTYKYKGIYKKDGRVLTPVSN